MKAAFTSPRLTADLRAIGLRSGSIVMVHSSLRRIGPTERGPATVVEALRATVGAEGTIVVPTFTAANSLSSPIFYERTRGMTAQEIHAFQEAMPGFDPATTPSTGMGAVAELVRTAPGARRSTHPQTSLAAWGPQADAITRHHPLNCHLGKDSPLQRLYELEAHVLLLGVGFEACTAFHLGEYGAPEPPVRDYDCFVAGGRQADGRPGRERRTFEAVDLNDRDFGRLGEWLEQQRTDTGQRVVRRGRVGGGIARLLPMALAVDLAVEWFKEHRTG